MLHEHFDKRDPFIQAYHGFGGSGLDFEPLVSLSKYSWNAPDLLGYGGSPKPKGISDYHTANQVKCCMQVAKGRVLLGYSMGGRLALHVATANPQRWKALVLISSTAGLWEGRAERQEWDRSLANKLKTHTLEQFWSEWSNLAIIQSQKRCKPSFISARKKRRLNLNQDALAASILGFGAGVMPSLWGELHRIKIPVLIVTGEEDAKYSEIAHRLLRNLPNAIHLKISECGHAPHLEAPKRFLVPVEEWLGSLSG